MSAQNTARPITVRPACRADVPELLILMRQLARFEGYIDDFRVTEQDLLDRGFCPSPEFHALVAVEGETHVGYAVYYTIPFTYDLQPRLIMKELYVVREARSHGVGEKLFGAVVSAAKAAGASSLGWLVLPDNLAAQRFYTRHGGTEDQNWQHWTLRP